MVIMATTGHQRGNQAEPLLRIGPPQPHQHVSRVELLPRTGHQQHHQTVSQTDHRPQHVNQVHHPANHQPVHQVHIVVVVAVAAVLAEAVAVAEAADLAVEVAVAVAAEEDNKQQRCFVIDIKTKKLSLSGNDSFFVFSLPVAIQVLNGQSPYPWCRHICHFFLQKN
jgi:anti-sigma-K factor RskA